MRRLAVSAHGIAAVRRISRVSNGIAAHVIDVDMSPEPAWADYSVPTHASLCVHIEHAGGRAELRLKRDQPAPDGSTQSALRQLVRRSGGTRRERYGPQASNSISTCGGYPKP